MKNLVYLVLMLGLLSSCASQEENAADADTNGNEVGQTVTQNKLPIGNSDENYVYEFQGVDVALGKNFDTALASLGEPKEYFEAASCAFDGLDKIYYYNGVEIRTYPQGDQDFVAAVLLKDDTVTTNEGVYIGMEMTDVWNKLGDNFIRDGKQYIYTAGESNLIILEAEGVALSITYSVPGTT